MDADDPEAVYAEPQEQRIAGHAPSLLCQLHASGKGARFLEPASRKCSIDALLEWREAPPASAEDLVRVHDPALLERLERAATAGRSTVDPDTYLTTQSVDVARRASGNALAAARDLHAGVLASAFVIARPPGHHAERDTAMGFCLFDHAAVAASWLREVAGLDRVAIVDFDVHHGNGTQDIFEADGSVFYASLHEWPLFPGTGAPDERGTGAGDGATLNLPQPAGATGREWLTAVERELLPALESFDPQFLILSAGFDAHCDDPLSRTRLETEDYAGLTEMITAGLPLPTLSILEGGYDLAALEESVRVHVQALGRAAEDRIANDPRADT